MSEGTPKFTSVPEGESRSFSPAEIAEAQEIVASMDQSPETPAIEAKEEGAESIAERITHEEERLEANLAENQSIAASAEARLSDPVAEQENSRSRWLVTGAKINEAYTKAKDKINRLTLMGFTGALAVLPVSMAVGMHGEAMKNSMDITQSMDAYQWTEAAAKIAEGGLASAAAVGAVWAISRTMNWLSKKKQEREASAERWAGANTQAA